MRRLVPLTLVLFTLALGVASGYACHRRIRREHEMLRLRSTAAAMQRHILHPLPLVTEDVLVNGVYEPVQEDQGRPVPRPLVGDSEPTDLDLIPSPSPNAAPMLLPTHPAGHWRARDDEAPCRS